VTTRRSLAALAPLVLACALALGACGGADNDKAGGGAAKRAGAPSRAPGFDGKTIRLGILTPLSGPAAVLGAPAASGAQVYFQAVNARGGIAGKYPVKVVEEDTQLKPDLTVQKYNKLKPDVAAFAQIVGTAPTLAVLPLMRRDQVIGAPASLDATWVRDPNLVPVGAPYQIQAINGLDYYVKHGGSKDKAVCSLIEDDAYGEAGQQGIDFAAKGLGLRLATTQRFKFGDGDVTGQIQQLRSKGCDMVFVVATPADAATIWGTSAKLGFAPRWIGQSATWVGAFAQSPLKSYLEKTTWIVYEGTEWGDTSVPGMATMLEAVKRFKPDQKPDQYFGFGYSQARAIAALLEKAVARGDVSRKGLLEASRELGSVSFAGISGDYLYGPPDRRDPPRASTIFKVNAGKPFGLEKAAFGFESPLAKDFAFKAAG
jgi:ABC-type branched-subunit amino acid transport system substrate-binding protein